MENRFNDADNVSDWARNAVAVCAKYEIVAGYNGSLRPKSNITRAEAVTVIMNMLKQAGLI